MQHRKHYEIYTAIARVHIAGLGWPDGLDEIRTAAAALAELIEPLRDFALAVRTTLAAEQIKATTDPDRTALAVKQEALRAFSDVVALLTTALRTANGAQAILATLLPSQPEHDAEQPAEQQAEQPT